MNKRGSLALSTNAIVTLIVAIVILGLLISFVTGGFDKIREDFEDSVGSSKIKNPPTYDNPFTVSRGEFEIRLDEEESIDISFYNYYDDEASVSIDLVSCAMGDDDTSDDFTFTTSGSKKVVINEYVTFATSIGAKKDAKPGVHACLIELTAVLPDSKYEYKDLLITVK